VSSTLADLEIATFAVDEVVEGTKTGRKGSTLVVDLPQLAVGAGSEALAEVTVQVVRPGDRVRIANVLDVVLPDVRPDDPGATFPGVLDPSRHPAPPATTGRVHRIAGVVVVSVCDWRAARPGEADELPDAFVDMDGPGADRNPWQGSTVVVVRCRPAADVPLDRADLGARAATLSVASSIAGATLGTEPDDVTPWRDPELVPADPHLPSIAAVVQVASEGPLLDTFRYGRAMRDLAPTAIDPRELLGGAILNGAYDWAAVRNVSAVYQGSELVRSLLSGHGDRFRVGATLVVPGYLDTGEAKRRTASRTAELLDGLGVDGAICTTFSSGNSHTDTMLTLRACETRGIAGVALLAETNGGLTDHVPEADCLVSTGNEDELVEAWTPERVLGSDDGARAGEPVPQWAYVGASVQTGDARWTAVPA
jgi:glycine reductase